MARPEDEKTSFVGSPRQGNESIPTSVVEAGQPQPRRLAWPARDNASSRRNDRPTEVILPDDTTRLVGSSNTKSTPAKQPVSDDPVVGWLVVVDGPGRGHSVEIGAGANPLGRGEDQRAPLPWGDKEISRERHAIIVFDPKSRRYYIHAGDSHNLAYVDGEVLMAPRELRGGETITLGATTLKFAPFCSDDFSWTD